MKFDPTKHLKGHPQKKPGRHRFVVIVAYNVAHEALKAATRGEEAHLDMENIATMTAGCIDCEMEWPPVHNFCRAPAYDEEMT